MRYIGNGFIDLDNAYLFDSSDFEIYSYFIFFDYTNQFYDLEGDITVIDFTYTNQDYSTEYNSSIKSYVSTMFNYFKTFNDYRDFSIGSYLSTEKSLRMNVMNFIEKINYYNQQIIKYDYYDHGINHVVPFAEFVVIKRNGYIIDCVLIKILEKSHDTTLSYTLRNQYYMSKFLFHYSTSGTDYNSIYVKSLYNRKDSETLNKPNMVVSTKLYRKIHNDSSKLYFDMSISGIVSNATDKYTFYDLSNNDLIYLNNTHFCRVYGCTDSTVVDGTGYRITATYKIEFLEFDNTGDLSIFMGGAATYYDFTLLLLSYYVNIRVIKKLNYNNEIFSSIDFYKKRMSLKTFFTPANIPSNETSSNWQNFFTTGFLTDPIIYSGTYDLTNNMKLNMLTFLNTFRSSEYNLPVDTTIDKTIISEKKYFTIDIFIDDSAEVNTFISYLKNFGIYIFQEGGSSATDVMIAKLLGVTEIDSNTLRLKFYTILYDEVWFSDISESYQEIPSDSVIIQYKFHIYNIIPYIDLSAVTFNNNINNLIDIHCFSYSMNNPSTLKQNGRSINV